MVLYERRQRRLPGTAKPSVLGDGLLERARSTSLALLGVTAAVGLGMVALALNQGWPLVAGSPIPGFGPRSEAVGAAVVAARAGGGHGGKALRGSTALPGPRASARPQGRSGGGTAAPAGSVPPRPQGTLVSHSTPAGNPEARSPDGAAPSPSPVVGQPAPAPVAAPAPAPSPATPPAGSEPQPTPEPAASPQPVLALHENEGQGPGHHYGKASQGVAAVHDLGEDDHSQGGAHSSQGHGHARAEGDAGQSQSPPESVPTTNTPPAPAPEPATAEDQGGTQPYVPAVSHGNGHGHGHW